MVPPTSTAARTTSEHDTRRAAVVKSVDMSDDMQSEAIEVANEALEKYSVEKVCAFAFSTALSQC